MLPFAANLRRLILAFHKSKFKVAPQMFPRAGAFGISRKNRNAENNSEETSVKRAKKHDNASTNYSRRRSEMETFSFLLLLRFRSL